MKIVFFGSADFGIPCLRALSGSKNTLAGIFTQPARPAGRKRKPKPTAVAIWSADNSVDCVEAENINSPQMVKKIAACKADLLLVIAFGQKVSQEIVNLHPKGAINVHASLLPKYRGAAPINWAIMNGDTQTGITIITLADKMDAGKMLAQSKTAITPDDTAGTLHDKLAESAVPLLTETMDHIAAGTAVYAGQDESAVTSAHKLKKSDGFIDWSDCAESIRNRIRSLYPWPGARADFVSAKTGKCRRVTIAKAQVVPTEKPLGSFGLLDENLYVICGKDTLKIQQLKPAGSSLMDFKDFVNGRAVAPGDLFMPIDRS